MTKTLRCYEHVVFMNMFQFSPSWGGERPVLKKVH